jgi:hypothetical protein
MQATAPRFEDHKGLIHMQALSGMKWAQGAGAGGVLGYEDMFQVASLAFHVAAAGYDPNSGFKFSAYFTKVAFSEFRKEIGLITGVKNLNEEQRAEMAARKEENARRRALALPELPEINYGLAPTLFGDMPLGPDIRDEPFEAALVDRDNAGPAERIEHADLWAKEEALMSPLAKVIVDMLRNPPDQLLQEIAAKRAYADECTAFGKRAYGLRDGITLAAICDFLALVGDITKRELTMAQGELMRALERIEKAEQE